MPKRAHPMKSGDIGLKHSFWLFLSRGYVEIIIKLWTAYLWYRHRLTVSSVFRNKNIQSDANV